MIAIKLVASEDAELAVAARRLERDAHARHDADLVDAAASSAEALTLMARWSLATDTLAAVRADLHTLAEARKTANDGSSRNRDDAALQSLEAWLRRCGFLTKEMPQDGDDELFRGTLRYALTRLHREAKGR